MPRSRARASTQEDGAQAPGAEDEGSPPATGERRRGRQPGFWPEGLSAGQLQAFKERFGLTEQRLADHLGVSVPTLRNWTKGGKAPSADRHEALRAALARDYDVAAVPPARRARGAQRGEGPTAPPEGDPSGARPASTAQAIVELALAYVRSPGGQNLTPTELIQVLERIRRTID